MKKDLGMGANELKQILDSKDAIVGVIGMGYVGLPLAEAFVGAGFHVVGFDVVQKTADSLNEGKSHIRDVSDQAVSEMVSSGRFDVTTDMTRLAEMHAVCICVPTPLNDIYDPDLSYVESAVRSIAENLGKGQLIVLESTTYPGTTREIVMPILEAGGNVCGEDFYLAYSPERVDPGNKKFGIRNTPKLIGGIEQASTDLGVALYSSVVDECVPVGSPEVAEMSKIVENTFRSVNIGFINEVALMCDLLGIDVWEVVDAAATKPFGFMSFKPGAGVGGHCIPLDPKYLSWRMRSFNYTSRFIELAHEVNSHMPRYVVEKTVLALNRQRKSIYGARVLVVGVAYKPNIDDARESPAIDVLEELGTLEADIAYHDPFVGSLRVGETVLESSDLGIELARGIDAAVIVTRHDDVDYQSILDNVPLVIDTGNATHGMTGSAVVVSI